LALARGYLGMLSSRSIGRAIPMMLVAKARSAELADAHTEFVWTRRAATHELIRRGIERGELPAGTDPAMVADMVFGAIFTRVFVTGEPTDDRYLGTLVERILAG
jgi:hypothetical protein